MPQPLGMHPQLDSALLFSCIPHTRLRYFCSPQRTDSTLYPIIGQMERAARLAHDDTPQAKLDKLDAVLAQTSTSIKDAALYCRDAVAAEQWTLPSARSDPGTAQAKNAGSLDNTSCEIGKPATGADDLRLPIGPTPQAWKRSAGRWTKLKSSRCCSSLRSAPSSMRRGLDGRT